MTEKTARFVIRKSTSKEDWMVVDTQRVVTVAFRPNQIEAQQIADQRNAEYRRALRTA